MRMHPGLFFAFTSASLIALQAAAQPAAQSSTGTQLEEVIVTAERRTVDVQRTPASVSVRTGDDLADQGRYTTRQILEDIPGIVAVDNGTRNLGSADVQGNSITIRGIAAQNSAAGGLSGISAAAGAAVYVDGVYEGIGSGYDIERVEVLRGPQGTLYGRSATTGVVAFHTRNPEMGKFGGDVSAEFANYDLQHYSAAVNIPLGENLAARISGDYYDQGEGYYEEAVRGLQKRENARVKLLWQPTDAFSLLLGAAYEKRDSFGGGKSYIAALPSFAQSSTNAVLVPGLKEQEQFWAEANWDVGPVTLTYQPAFRSWTQDDTNISVNALNSGQNRRTLQKTPKDDFVTHEFRVSNNSDGGFHWQAGVFYYSNKLLNTVLAQYESPAGVPGAVTSESRDSKDTRNIGVFAETTIPLRDSLRVTLGGRYDDTKIVVSEYLYDNDFQNCGNGVGLRVTGLPPGASCTGPGTATVPSRGAVNIDGIEAKFSMFSYKARLEYDITPANMVYGMVSTAFRPGDAGIQSRLPNILNKEKLTSFEVGSKNRFLDDSLQVNASAFHYNYEGFRILYQPDIFVPGSFINAQVPTINIGAELEVLYRLTPRDRIGVDYSYVQSRFYDKPAGFAAAFPQTKRALTPYTISANYSHTFDLPGGSTLVTRIDGRYEAAHQARELQAQYLAIGYDRFEYLEARTIGNLSAVWNSADGHFAVSAYVRNFTDEQYKLYTVSTNLTRLALDWSDPRTFGVQLNARF